LHCDTMKYIKFSLIGLVLFIPSLVFGAQYINVEGVFTLPHSDYACGATLYEGRQSPNPPIDIASNFFGGNIGGQDCSGTGTTTINFSHASGVYTYILGTSDGSGHYVDPLWYSYFTWDNNTQTATDAGNTATRIDTVTPENATSTATSTAGVIGATGYTNADDVTLDTDLLSDAFLRITVTNQSIAQAGASPSVASAVYNIPLTDVHDFATTTVTPLLNIGRYNMTTEIRVPAFIFFSKVLVSTSTYFIVATSTGYDRLLVDPIAVFTGEDTLDLEACRISFSGTFALGTCLAQLLAVVFIPSDRNWEEFRDVLSNGIIHKFPLGYVTRMIEIVGGNSTSTLPLINVTMKEDSPFPGSFHFNPETYIAEADTLVRTSFTSDLGVVDNGGAPQNVWDIIMPDLTILAWILLVFRIFYEVIGYRGDPSTHMFGKKAKRTGITRDEYRYKEKLYELSQRK